jgi:choline dehydrogenase-like flavoprotein
MYYVVGSGPSGVSAAVALRAAGLPVTILDVGREAEPDRLAVLQSLAATPEERWRATDLDRIRGSLQWDATFPKLSYGSDFPYAREEIAQVVQHGTRCLWSHARGGLSNVWGAAVLPNLEADMSGWPVTAAAMAPHYAAVAHLLGIAGRDDDLAAIFPYYEVPDSPARVSRQATLLLETMDRHREQLRAAGVRFGQSRLALRTRPRGSAHECSYTGLCLSGCPHGAIWSSAHTLDALIESGVHYRSGVVVRKVEATDDGVRLLAVDGASGEASSFVGRRAFLACGPLATARIVIDSLVAYDRSFQLRYQPYFLLPMLGLRDGGDVGRERLHTLAQVFIEIMAATVSRHAVHLQMYTFNEVMRAQLASLARYGWLRRFGGRVLLGRLLAIQGYLHSDDAAPITLQSRFDARRGCAQLTLTAAPQADTRRIIGRAVRHLARHAFAIGAIPLLPMLRHGEPGEGNHIGAIFPMSDARGQLDTDRLGSLERLPRLHLVDASVLPALAATTFTYTVMANAHRIASEVARQDAAA